MTGFEFTSLCEMLDVHPHWCYIIAAYAVTIITLAGLVVMPIAKKRNFIKKQKRILDMIENNDQ